MALRLYFTAAAFIYGVAAEEETCRENVGDTESSCSSSSLSGSASLLQKTFQRDGKGLLSEAEVHEGRPVCTGVTAQGKCWYLSQVGDSCEATCARKGRSFSYVLADVDNPLIPQLAGREIRTKQEPWAALECLVPGEDRFHIAKANAADGLSKIGNWTHPLCQLACPCGKPLSEETCSWKPAPACAPEFEWKGVTITGGCLKTVDHNKPWCLHNRSDNNNDNDAWSDCVYTCGADKVPTGDACKWIASPKCVAEFDHSGAHYVGCTDNILGTPWCSHSDPFKGSWSHCEDTCAKKPPANGKLCSWFKHARCASTFVYKGVEYSECATIDHLTPWCSHHGLHEGEWTPCEERCFDAEGGSDKQSPPTGAPCDRAYSEDDEVGNLATLDEAGYKIVFAASKGTANPNMHRYVCRVVNKLDCEVVEKSGLVDFATQKSTTTYNHLESQLNTLCQVGGAWIVPKSLS